MFTKLMAGLAVLALAFAVPAVAFSTADSTPVPCVCCGEACTCVGCDCDEYSCSCDTGGQCACSETCEACLCSDE